MANQKLEPTWTTPVESGNVNSTQPHLKRWPQQNTMNNITEHYQWVLFLFPAAIGWLLQRKYKFDENYVAIILYLTFGCSAWTIRKHYIDPETGFLIDTNLMILISICFFPIALWQLIITLKYRNIKNGNEDKK